jgi:hypothetical protein
MELRTILTLRTTVVRARSYWLQIVINGSAKDQKKARESQNQVTKQIQYLTFAPPEGSK